MRWAPPGYALALTFAVTAPLLAPGWIFQNATTVKLSPVAKLQNAVPVGFVSIQVPKPPSAS